AALVGRLVALPEAEALPLLPGQFYPWQLEGCRVSTEDGREVGRVIRIEQSAAQDLWVVSDGARECLIPAVAEIVLEGDVAAGRAAGAVAARRAHRHRDALSRQGRAGARGVDAGARAGTRTR